MCFFVFHFALPSYYIGIKYVIDDSYAIGYDLVKNA